MRLVHMLHACTVDVSPGRPWKVRLSACSIIVAAVNTVLCVSAPIVIVAVEERRGEEGG